MALLSELTDCDTVSQRLHVGHCETCAGSARRTSNTPPPLRRSVKVIHLALAVLQPLPTSWSVRIGLNACTSGEGGGGGVRGALGMHHSTPSDQALALAAASKFYFMEKEVRATKELRVFRGK